MELVCPSGEAGPLDEGCEVRMYISDARGYYDRDGQQRVAKADFIILMHPKNDRCQKCDEDREYHPYDEGNKVEYRMVDGEDRKCCTICGTPITDSLDFPIRAIVRKVALQQSGPWMIGTARAFGKSIHISGSYGNDGLTRNVDWDVYSKGEKLPDELYQLWKHGGGWNGAGSEASEMAKFGRTIKGKN